MITGVVSEGEVMTGEMDYFISDFGSGMTKCFQLDGGVFALAFYLTWSSTMSLSALTFLALDCFMSGISDFGFVLTFLDL